MSHLNETHKQKLKEACERIQQEYGDTPGVESIGLVGDRIIIKLSDNSAFETLPEICDVNFEVILYRP